MISADAHPFDGLSVLQLQRGVSKVFERAGIVSSEPEARLVIAHVLGVSPGDLSLPSMQSRTLSGDQTRALVRIIERRSAREPLQHILQRAAFRYLDLEVGPGAFIPRPETEVLVDIALDLIDRLAFRRVVDLGTGSGAIAISIASERPSTTVSAVEASPDALRYARTNAIAAGVAIEFIEGRYPEVFGTANDARYDLIVANPPYIPIDQVPVDPEVRDYDPALALYSGEDGLDAVRSIAELAWIVEPGGMLVLEHGELQSAAIAQILDDASWRAVSHRSDLAGRQRFTVATAPRRHNTGENE